jgi:hypothetical protein
MPHTAAEQSNVPAEKLINSATAGFLVHRAGQIKYEFRSEATEFARELVSFINPAHVGRVSVLLFEEVFGDADRLHWMLHMNRPDDYGALLDMVDHDKKWQEIADMDRLPTKGGGGWERMFIEQSIQETVMCPQHGLGHGEPDEAAFQPPARHQTVLPYERLLHTANAPLVLHRTLHAAYAHREEARLFCYEWAAKVTELLDGEASAFLYEEMWGRQDRLHLLLHARDLDTLDRARSLERESPEMRDLLARDWIPKFKGGGTWEDLVLDGSITQTVLRPVAPVER